MTLETEPRRSSLAIVAGEHSVQSGRRAINDWLTHVDPFGQFEGLQTGCCVPQWHPIYCSPSVQLDIFLAFVFRVLGDDLGLFFKVH